MSITVRMLDGKRQLSRYAESQTMDDVMRYLAGWIAPKAPSLGLRVEITQSNGEARLYQLRTNRRSLTLIPSGEVSP